MNLVMLCNCVFVISCHSEQLQKDFITLSMYMYIQKEKEITPSVVFASEMVLHYKYIIFKKQGCKSGLKREIVVRSPTHVPELTTLYSCFITESEQTSMNEGVVFQPVVSHVHTSILPPVTTLQSQIPPSILLPSSDTILHVVSVYRVWDMVPWSSILGSARHFLGQDWINQVL